MQTFISQIILFPNFLEFPKVIRENDTRIRNDNNFQKWIMPRYMYDKEFYPPFLGGAGYLVSRNVAQCLLRKSKVETRTNYVATKMKHFY